MHKSLLLITIVCVSQIICEDVICYGNELSASNNSELSKITEKRCTHVNGDIYLRNISNAQSLPQFWSIEELHGSLIIEETINLMDSINLNNLRKIAAKDKPAIIIKNNFKLNLIIGSRLQEVICETCEYKYFIKSNTPASITVDLYNVLHLASLPEPAFFLDARVEDSIENDTFYQTLSAVLGLLSVFLSIAILIVGCFGRESLHED